MRSPESRIRAEVRDEDEGEVELGLGVGDGAVVAKLLLPAVYCNKCDPLASRSTSTHTLLSFITSHIHSNAMYTHTHACKHKVCFWAGERPTKFSRVFFFFLVHVSIFYFHAPRRQRRQLKLSLDATELFLCAAGRGVGKCIACKLPIE